MKEVIQNRVSTSETLNQIRDELFSIFRELREEGYDRIGFVSGIITSRGEEHIDDNLKNLARHTQNIREKVDYPVFSPTDVFTDELFDRLMAAGFVNDDWMVFWREVLTAEEEFVTDIFMTPGWEDSVGARQEFNIAVEREMNLYFVEDN